MNTHRKLTSDRRSKCAHDMLNSQCFRFGCTTACLIVAQQTLVAMRLSHQVSLHLQLCNEKLHAVHESMG